MIKRQKITNETGFHVCNHRWGGRAIARVIFGVFPVFISRIKDNYNSFISFHAMHYKCTAVQHHKYEQTLITIMATVGKYLLEHSQNVVYKLQIRQFNYILAITMLKKYLYIKTLTQ